MADKQTPPDWVFLEAAKRSGRTGSIEYLRRYYAFSTQADFRALCDMIERYEAFRQEVSDAVEKALYQMRANQLLQAQVGLTLTPFIIAKPDPLEEVMEELVNYSRIIDAASIRAAIEKRGGKIVWGEG